MTVRAVINRFIGGGIITNRLVVGFKASCLGRTLLAFFLLGLVDSIFLVIELLFTNDLVILSSLEINSNSLIPLLLIKLLILIKLAILAGELFFIGGSVELVLVLLTLEIGLIPIKGLVKFVILIVVKLIFVDGLALLVHFINYLAKSPSIEFSSLKLF